MVSFDRLRLLGFKTFVEPVDFHIESGLTGIVGPNGCGKSNLVEALRWVMGENSSKNMRASGMDDVIFSGANGRPSRNTAEVTLFLGNADRMAPPNYAEHDAIEVSRRIEREAGSVYRINGREARARDVQLLFADSSTGSRSPALVGQGRIGELIAAKPAARRRLLEEAAGISGLHTRRHEAELRLRAAEGNLERIEDVLRELDVQIESLRRQSRQARRYKTLSGEIRKLEAAILHLRWLAASTTMREANTAHEAVSATVQDAQAAQANAARNQAVAAHAVPGLRDAAAVESAKLQRLIRARDDLDREEKQLKERAAELDQRLEQLQHDKTREDQLLVDAERAVAALDTEARSLGAENAEAENAVSESGARTEAAQARLEKSEAVFQALTDEVAGIAATRRQLEAVISEHRQKTEKLQGQIDGIVRQRGELEAKRNAQADLDAGRAAVEQSEAALRKAEAELAEAEAARSKATAGEQDAQAPVTALEQAVGRAEAEAETLASVLSLDEADLWPAIVDAVKVAPGYELALAAALGEDLDASGDTAAPSHWREPGPHDSDHPLPEGVEPLAALVDGPAVLERRLHQIGVVDSDDGPAIQKRLAPGQRLVSAAGDLWRWDGFTVTADAPRPAAQRLEQKNRFEDLDWELKDLRAKLDEARMALTSARTASQEAGTKEAAARQALRDAERQAREARDALSKGEKATNEFATRLGALTEAEARLQDNLDESRFALKEAETALADAATSDPLEERLAAARDEAARDRQALAEARAIADRFGAQIRVRSDRLSAIDREKKSWDERTANARAQLAIVDGRVAETERERAALSERPDDITSARRALLTEIQEAEGLVSAANDRLAEGEKALSEADRIAKQALEILSGTRQEEARAEERISAARARQADIARHIEEALECAPHELAELSGIEPDGPVPDEAALETRLDRYKRERERLGAVNLRAEEEMSELEERRTTLTTERDDLVEAIRKFRHAIHTLNSEARSRLMEAFERVNSEFATLFQRLFGGGRAELKLIDSDDPLDAGLEIYACPPGKKTQVMTLLSGGEQALTAMSLIFAVFLTNPAPICVLDEVDAPLDDANVERFCTLLDEMRKATDTRFVCVTHNPITMARMDRLFGVTMAERGVSQLVSVDLRTAESYRQAG
ncbi:MAG: AAA family ATPase [Pseudomonadota bacterium]